MFSPCPLLLPWQTWLPRQWDFLLVRWSELRHVLQGLPGNKLPQTLMRSGLRLKTSLQWGKRAGGASCARGGVHGPKKAKTQYPDGDKMGGKANIWKTSFAVKVTCPVLTTSCTILFYFLIVSSRVCCCCWHIFTVHNIGLIQTVFLSTSNALTAFTLPTLSL